MKEKMCLIRHATPPTLRSYPMLHPQLPLRPYPMLHPQLPLRPYPMLHPQLPLRPYFMLHPQLLIILLAIAARQHGGPFVWVGENVQGESSEAEESPGDKS